MKADRRKFRNFPSLHNLARFNFDLLDFNFTQANPITAQVKMLPSINIILLHRSTVRAYVV